MGAGPWAGAFTREIPLPDGQTPMGAETGFLRSGHQQGRSCHQGEAEQSSGTNVCILQKSLKIMPVFGSWQVTDAIVLSGLNEKDLRQPLQHLIATIK